MSVPQRVSMVTLGVADVARSTSFCESLGWRRSSASQDTVIFFSMEGSVLALFGRDVLAEDTHLKAAGSGFRAVTLALDCAGPAEVDAVYSAGLDAGTTPVKPPWSVFWGGYSSYVCDPDGHPWEIAHNPYAPNDAHGRMQLPD